MTKRLPADADRNTFLHRLGIHRDPVAAKKRIAKATREGVRLGSDAYGYSRAFSHSPTEKEQFWLAEEARKLGILEKRMAGQLQQPEEDAAAAEDDDSSGEITLDLEGLQSAFEEVSVQDELEALKKLLISAGSTSLMCFTGRGGELPRRGGSWEKLSREEVKRGFKAGECDPRSYEDNSDSMELWVPGSPLFPLVETEVLPIESERAASRIRFLQALMGASSAVIAGR